MRHLTAALVPLLLLIAPAKAADVAVLPDPFSVTVEREPNDMADTVFRAFITAHETKFTFLIPQGYSTSGDPAHGRLAFKTSQGGGFISLVFVSGSSVDAKAVPPEPYRDLLAERYPSGKFVNQFTRPVGGRQGTVFDLEWKTATGLSETTRAVYFPTAAGVIELTITCSTKDFPQARNVFNQVLTTFVASIDGKLHFSHFADGPA